MYAAACTYISDLRPQRFQSSSLDRPACISLSPGTTSLAVARSAWSGLPVGRCDGIAVLSSFRARAGQCCIGSVQHVAGWLVQAWRGAFGVRRNLQGRADQGRACARNGMRTWAWSRAGGSAGRRKAACLTPSALAKRGSKAVKEFLPHGSMPGPREGEESGWA